MKDILLEELLRLDRLRKERIAKVGKGEEKIFVHEDKKGENNDQMH